MTVKRVRIKDRRQAVRHSLTLEVSVQRPSGVVVGAGVGPFPGKTLDISQTGIRFFCRESFGRREHLQLTVFGPGGEAMLKVLLEVMRVLKVTGGYEMGARFLETLPVDPA